MNGAMKTLGLWDWSAVVYAKPQVSQICMRLQDQFGQNVNALLWSCWLGVKQMAPTADALDAQMEICKSPHANVVIGGRGARRKLENSLGLVAPDLISSLLEFELLLEKYIQEELEALPALAASSQMSAQNLAQDNLDLLMAVQTMHDPACARLVDTLCRRIFQNPPLE